MFFSQNCFFLQLFYYFNRVLEVEKGFLIYFLVFKFVLLIYKFLFSDILFLKTFRFQFFFALFQTQPKNLEMKATFLSYDSLKGYTSYLIQVIDELDSLAL